MIPQGPQQVVITTWALAGLAGCLSGGSRSAHGLSTPAQATERQSQGVGTRRGPHQVVITTRSTWVSSPWGGAGGWRCRGCGCCGILPVELAPGPVEPRELDSLRGQNLPSPTLPVADLLCQAKTVFPERNSDW